MQIKVIDEEGMSNLLAEMTEIETVDIGIAFLNVGKHPSLGRVVGVSSAAGKSAYISISNE